MIRFENVTFRYDPFPIGLIPGIFNDADFRELSSTFPAPELFHQDGKLGDRYSLSPFNAPLAYRAHLRRHRAWRELARLVGSSSFVSSMIQMLLAHDVDLGVSARGRSMKNYLWGLAQALRYGTAFPLRTRPQSEMIFAMMPADGGSLLPHTDSLLKLLNLVATMSPENEWNQDFGGGTDVNRPKDQRRWFNRANLRLNFEDVDILDTVPFRPDQGLIVVRSDISWHSIRPMTGKDSGLHRKTVNINLLGCSL